MDTGALAKARRSNTPEHLLRRQRALLESASIQMSFLTSAMRRLQGQASCLGAANGKDVPVH